MLAECIKGEGLSSASLAVYEEKRRFRIVVDTLKRSLHSVLNSVENGSLFHIKGFISEISFETILI